MRRLIFSLLLILVSMLLIPTFAMGYEIEINRISEEMAEAVSQKNKQRIAVVDFTDLQGNVTELGRFIAEEFSVALLGKSEKFQIVDRTHLKSLIKEHKLSETGLIDPKTARKLGEIAGVDALITGTITPFGENIRISVKVLDVNTAMLIAAKNGKIAATEGIKILMASGISAHNNEPGISNTPKAAPRVGNAKHPFANLPKTWNGYWKSRSNTMIIQIDKIDGKYIHGFINWPTYKNTTTKIKGEIVNDFGNFLEQTKWRFVKNFESDKSGHWIKFTEYEFLHGNGVLLDGWYYARLDSEGKKIEGIYFPKDASNPKGNIELSLKK